MFDLQPANLGRPARCKESSPRQNRSTLERMQCQCPGLREWRFAGERKEKPSTSNSLQIGGASPRGTPLCRHCGDPPRVERQRGFDLVTFRSSGGRATTGNNGKNKRGELTYVERS